MADKKDSFMNMGSDPSEGKSHPVGKAVGGTAGAVVGAVAGSPAGPIGTVAGAAIGGIAGWLEGKTIAEGVNPDTEMEYWQNNSSSAPYFNKSRKWSDYEPAYKMGVYSYNDDTDYEDIEEDLETDWEDIRGDSSLDWMEAKEASKDAYTRIASRKKRSGEII